MSNFFHFYFGFFSVLAFAEGFSFDLADKDSIPAKAMNTAQAIVRRFFMD